MGRFETEFLTQEDNRQALARMNTRWVERAMAHTLHQRVILDMDSSESVDTMATLKIEGARFVVTVDSTSIWRPEIDYAIRLPGVLQRDSASADTAY